MQDQKEVHEEVLELVQSSQEVLKEVQEVEEMKVARWCCNCRR